MLVLVCDFKICYIFLLCAAFCSFCSSMCSSFSQLRSPSGLFLLSFLFSFFFFLFFGRIPLMILTLFWPYPPYLNDLKSLVPPNLGHWHPPLN